MARRKSDPYENMSENERLLHDIIENCKIGERLFDEGKDEEAKIYVEIVHNLRARLKEKESKLNEAFARRDRRQKSNISDK